jgi:hypothetical protein
MKQVPLVLGALVLTGVAQATILEAVTTSTLSIGSVGITHTEVRTAPTYSNYGYYGYDYEPASQVSATSLSIGKNLNLTVYKESPAPVRYVDYGFRDCVYHAVTYPDYNYDYGYDDDYVYQPRPSRPVIIRERPIIVRPQRPIVIQQRPIYVRQPAPPRPPRFVQRPEYRRPEPMRRHDDRREPHFVSNPHGPERHRDNGHGNGHGQNQRGRGRGHR